ncbi:ATP-dependent DNA helicase RecG, partial [Candidatus Berkelbacteria bacterium]|nr:ATP-dependent DNA helicase RecG [Candidatus Berkelbacteria bacterium]
MFSLNTPVAQLVGVGPKIVSRLNHLGIERIGDLLFYFPRDWQDLSHPVSIVEARVGEVNTLRVKIESILNRRSPARKMILTEAVLADDSGKIKAIWFNQPFLTRFLRRNQTYIFQGKLEHSRGLIFFPALVEKEMGILPIYSESAGVNSKFLRRLIKPLLFLVRQSEELAEFLPQIIIKKYDLLDRRTALEQIHFPQNEKLLKQAKRRLSFEELFLLCLRMQVLRKELKQNLAPAIVLDIKLLQKFVRSLPFSLTFAQKRSIWEIVKDLSRPAPMNRLLEGDVGSGKTVVAAAGVLLAAKSNFQSVWLAPTEVLANQHAQSVSKLLEPFGISVGLLTAATSKKAAEISQNQLIIGTHAILQKDIILPNLAFVIVDEQHRFGVKQRAWLRQPTTDNQQPTTTHPIPHFLSMTATPIPRTLALSIFGDLDISVLDELPPGRKKVETKIVPPLQRKAAYDFIRQQVKKGRQIFVICPLIEKKEDGKALNLFELDRKSAIAEYEKLSKEIFPDLRIGLLHGKMKSKEKEEVMGRFKNREIDILVSTAVIEVGIDIPN